MRKFALSILALATVATSFTSCKKGDEDPSISLRSRAGRLAGEWKLDSYEDKYTEINTSNSGGTTTTNQDDYDTKLSGTSATMTINSKSTTAGITVTSSQSMTGTVTEFTYTIEKDGTWESKQIIKYTSATYTDPTGTETEAIDMTQTITQSGTWQFLGKNKSADVKGKEDVAFSVAKMTSELKQVDNTGGVTTTYTSTDNDSYARNENIMVWHLTRLANSEVTADYEYDYNYTGSSTYSSPGFSSSSTYGPDSQKGTGTLKLTQE